MDVKPPYYAGKLLCWFIKDELAEEVLGDLDEKFHHTRSNKTTTRAKLNYWYQVFNYVRPFAIKNKRSNSNNLVMIKNYFKIHWRNTLRHKAFSSINIAGLALGMAVALLIGVWIEYETSFNKYHESYDRIAQVYQNQTFESEIQTWQGQALQLAPILRQDYTNLFEHVVTSSYNNSYVFKADDKVIRKRGVFIEPEGPEIISIKMIQGSRKALEQPNTILISESFKNSFFGDQPAMGESVTLADDRTLVVAGIYEDIHGNTKFNEIDYMGEWEFYKDMRDLEGRVGWGASWFRVFVKLQDGANSETASMAINQVKYDNMPEDQGKRFKPELFLHPMAKWRLYSEYTNGINSGGRITYVWLFGIIGLFVLLLACINFMNLNTARADKRAKEIGIRKSLGSLKGQLRTQYYSESLFITIISFIAALVLSVISMPYFNRIIDIELSIPLQSGTFWLASIGFVLFTSILAGSYPALLLSSFSPIKSLKRQVSAGGGLLRKILVVFQFSISIILIIGTMVVDQQIQHAKNRPLGYDVDGLITMYFQSGEEYDNFPNFKNALIEGNIASAVSTSESEVTNTWINNSGFSWEGKEEGMQDQFITNAVGHDFGQVVNWKILEGRNFDKNLAKDSLTMIINQAAVDYLGFKDPIGKNIDAFGEEFTIIGIVENLLNQTAYDPIPQTIYYFDFIGRSSVINIKINPNINISTALTEIERTYKSMYPDSPFDYEFASDDLERKYRNEERISKLATISSIITILISALGIFAMAAFFAERKAKEISIRKILGASVGRIWMLLSKQFGVLILVAGVIATPIAYFYLQSWLDDYSYRTNLSWWIFGSAILIAFVITVATISYQTIKAALVNPVETLRSE
ncbi:MAG: ABC transporter permease [Bacteroidota bacterium]